MENIHPVDKLVEIVKTSQVLEFTIPEKPPAKKNSKEIIYKNGRPFIIPSKAHKKWHDMALQYLKYGVKLPQNEPLNPKMVLCIMHGKTKHKWDVSNTWETLQDLLVDANIIPDDNYDYVNKLVLFFGGIEKENPRSEISIYY